MRRPLLIAACGGLGREVAEAARIGTDWEPIGFLDDDPATWDAGVAGLPVLGALDAATGYPEAGIAVCAGKGAARLAMVERLAKAGLGVGRLATVVHPDVSVSPDSTLGPGCILLARAVLTAAVRLGRLVVCMPGVVLTHDDVVEDGATLCAGVVLGGSVHVGRSAYLGMGCSVRENTRIGPDTMVGMGAVVLNDVMAGEWVCGVPARPMTTRAIRFRSTAPWSANDTAERD